MFYWAIIFSQEDDTVCNFNGGGLFLIVILHNDCLIKYTASSIIIVFAFVSSFLILAHILDRFSKLQQITNDRSIPLFLINMHLNESQFVNCYFKRHSNLLDRIKARSHASQLTLLAICLEEYLRLHQSNRLRIIMFSIIAKWKFRKLYFVKDIYIIYKLYIYDIYAVYICVYIYLYNFL